jgi:hypothetical protein
LPGERAWHAVLGKGLCPVLGVKSVQYTQF